MNKLTLVAAALLGIAALATPPAHALTATDEFSVTVNLYPKCEFVSAPVALALNYVSFQTTVSENDMSFSLKCTNTLPYTLSIGGNQGASGTLVGLNYTLATRFGGAAATTGVGNGAEQTWAVRGTIAANQGGTCAQDNSGTAGTQDTSVTGSTAGQGTACTGTTGANDHNVTITY